MSDITIEAVKLRRRELEINIAMAQGALEEINNIIAEMERRRGGRPRKPAAGLKMINEPAWDGEPSAIECDEQGPLPSLDDVRGILKTEERTA